MNNFVSVMEGDLIIELSKFNKEAIFLAMA